MRKNGDRDRASREVAAGVHQSHGELRNRRDHRGADTRSRVRTSTHTRSRSRPRRSRSRSRRSDRRNSRSRSGGRKRSRSRSRNRSRSRSQTGSSKNWKRRKSRSKSRDRSTSTRRDSRRLSTRDQFRSDSDFGSGLRGSGSWSLKVTPPPPPDISVSGRSEGRSRPRVYGPRPGSSGMYNSRYLHDPGQSPSTTTPTIYTCRNRGIRKGCGQSFEIQDDYLKHIADRSANDGNCPDIEDTKLANPPPPQEKSPGGGGPKTRTIGVASSTQPQSATHRALYTGPVVEVDISKSPDHPPAEADVHAPSPLPPRESESPVEELPNPLVVTSTAIRHPQEQSPGDSICLEEDDRPVSPPPCGFDEEEVSILGDVVFVHNPVCKTIAADTLPDSCDSNLTVDGSVKKIMLPPKVGRMPSEKTFPNLQPSSVKKNESFDRKPTLVPPKVRDNALKGSILEEMDPNRTASTPSLSMDNLSEPMTGAAPDFVCESTPRQSDTMPAMDTSSDAGSAESETATGKTQRKKPRMSLPAFLTDVEVNSSKDSEEGKCNTSKKKQSDDEMEILLDKRKREQFLANKSKEPSAVSSTQSFESLTFVTESLSKEKELDRENNEENELSMTIEICQEVKGNFDKNENNEKKVECPHVDKFPCLVCNQMFPEAAELASHSMKCFINSNECEEDSSSNEIANGGSPSDEDELSVTDKNYGSETDQSIREVNTELDDNVPIEDHENSPNEHESYIENSGHRKQFSCSVCSETFVEASELACHSSNCFLDATGCEEETDTGNLFVSEEYPQDVGEDSFTEEAVGKPADVDVDVDVSNPAGCSTNNDEASYEASSVEVENSVESSNDVTLPGDSEASNVNVGEEVLTAFEERSKDYEDSTRSFEVPVTRFQNPGKVTTLRDALKGFEESETESDEEDDIVELYHGKFFILLCLLSFMIQSVLDMINVPSKLFHTIYCRERFL